MDRKVDVNGPTRLGQILIDKRLISESQLDAAMREQSRSGRRLGEILADMKLITRAQVQGAIRRQRLLRLAAGLATAFLGPAQAYAAGVTPVAATSVDARPFGDASGAWSGTALDQVVAGRLSAIPHGADAADTPVQAAGLRMQALDDTNALAMFQHAVATAQTMQQGVRGASLAGVRVAAEIGKPLDPPADGPALNVSLDVHVSQVSTGPGIADAAAGKDGTVMLDVRGHAGDVGVRDLRAGAQASAALDRAGGRAR